ncbi:MULTISPECIES: F0F1 ATP synthase subunit B [Clostridia]|jgi:F-type H+-transporting ATPase subunit b|uniref:F0F1 ATP synthase subunit B n=1 Tax=Clostridia TaxID=186801 RepID=UPI0007407171|nr:F0F1 ATP synthase subunit B [Clostridium sp. WB02_MRS01]MBW4846632.1 F0F1 ATP synthase subunit B [Lachnospiraceae bacterium]MSS10305.1 F0F1 ATP synthase subunit B [Clostridium sp. WB02_MRS01]CUX51507.1 ATP synthase subunit b, sodium ion specific [Clostridium sp. C105KSO15]
MLRLDMNFVWTIVNLIVLYLLLRHFLIGPVLDVMNKRRGMIEQSISDARNKEVLAADLKKQYEVKLAASSDEGSKLIEEAKNQAKAQYDRILKDAEEDAGRLMAEARKQAEADQEKALREAKAQIAGIVIAAAAKVVNQEVSARANQALYDSFIAEAGDFHDAGSN